MAPNFLALATTLENLGARRLLAKKVNFMPCKVIIIVIQFMFLGVNMFWALLRAHYNPLSQAKNMNINSIVLLDVLSTLKVGLRRWWAHLPSTNVAQPQTVRGFSSLVLYSALTILSSSTPVSSSHQKHDLKLSWFDLQSLHLASEGDKC